MRPPDLEIRAGLDQLRASTTLERHIKQLTAGKLVGGESGIVRSLANASSLAARTVTAVAVTSSPPRAG